MWDNEPVNFQHTIVDEATEEAMCQNLELFMAIHQVSDAEREEIYALKNKYIHVVSNETRN